MPRYSVEEYVGFAEQALLELVREEYAVSWAEAQAKIADRRWPSVPLAVNPHHMTTARARLLQTGRVRLSGQPGRGGSTMHLLHPADDRGIKDRIRTAARRKRALLARLEAWARSSTRYPAGLVGTAGERVVQASLLEAARFGVRPAQPMGGSVSVLLGAPVEGGELDNAAWVEDLDEYGRSRQSVLCPIEVKNIRHWIYPRSVELFQVL